MVEFLVTKGAAEWHLICVHSFYVGSQFMGFSKAFFAVRAAVGFFSYLCMMRHPVSLQSTRIYKFHIALCASEWFFTCVDPCMSFHSSGVIEFLGTKTTAVWLFICVDRLMSLQVILLGKFFATFRAGVCFLIISGCHLL